MRRCLVCGASLEGRRRQTRTCSDVCRAEASRLRRLLASGGPVDGFSCVADRLDYLVGLRAAVRFPEPSGGELGLSHAQQR